MNIIYLRDEYILNECRTPLTPLDIKKLIKHGFKVYIQYSNKRVYNNDDYKNIVDEIEFTNEPWYSDKFKNALIIGLKEIEHLDKLSNHKHLYFSHSYKNQYGSDLILNAFKNSNSIIYDFEYFLYNNKKRIISFGFYAGVVGAVLGLLQYSFKRNYNDDISDLHYFYSIEELLETLSPFKDDFLNINIGIIGYKGNCGNGVTYILDKLNINYVIIEKFSTIKEFDFDIFYNCILLKPQSKEVFFDENSIFKKQTTIVDISCDCYVENNPIKIYNECTTWKNPVYNYNDYVDIISICNLPSLLPKESSDYFSNKCFQLLLEMNNDKNGYWSNCKKEYIKNIDKNQIEKISNYYL
jgi:saccharopine dehydrogenase (NAD+, L-lysine-forming)